VKARIVQLHGNEHDAVQSLLPWYVNGTLDAAELDRVRDHLRGCAQCQADIAWQERFCTPGQLAGEPVPAQRIDRDWAALARRIRADAPRAPRPPSRASWRTAPWWPFAFAAQSALAAILLVAWLVAPPREEPSYHALGAAPSATSANVLVVFRPTATEADIRQALRTSRAQLVAGPTVTDAYLLRLEPLTADTIATLRAQGAVLRVDSLEAAPR
jgi:anti-sigma factor RsiW